MLEKLFNVTEDVAKKEETKRLQEEKFAKEEAEREKRLQIEEATLNTFDLLREYIQKQEIERQLPITKEEQITISAGGIEFDTQNFKYNALIVGSYEADTVLEIDYMGIRYTETLTQGVNQLNLPNQCRVTKRGGEPIVAGLIRSNHPLKP